MSADDGADDPAPPISFSPSAWRAVPAKMAEALGPRGLPVRASEDLARVLRLPRRPQVTEGSATAEAMVQVAMRRYSRHLLDASGRPVGVPGHLLDAVTRQPVKCGCRKIDPRRFADGRAGCISTLLWVQAWALVEAEQCGGLIASVPVGGGKTVNDVLVPLALRDCRLALLLIPPSLVEQFVTDYQLVAEHFYVPSAVVHLSGKRTWYGPVQRSREGSQAPTLHVLPYSQLSSITASQWIEKLGPDAIIADEVDALKSLESARVLRLLRYYAEHWRTTKFCGWTGTLTGSKLADFAHLSALALRESSPLPLDPQVTEEWGRCVDAVPSPAPAGALTNLLAPGEPATLAAVRAALRRRIAETAGFVVVGGRQVIERVSGGEEVGLRIVERAAPALPDVVDRALGMVRQAIRPDTLGGAEEDEVIADPLEQARCALEVASGVFHKWKFPPIDGVPQRRELIQEWYAARKLWNSELREKMLRGEQDLDSLGLCERAAMRAWGDAPADPSLPEWEAESWPRWRDIMDRVKYEPEAVRLDPYLVDDAIAWAREHLGIVWYANKSWGRWVRERSGLPLHEGGAGAGEALRREDGSRSIVASLKSHGRGRNGLQFVFHKNLIGQFPSSATAVEQLAGRTHRRGQERDVEMHFYAHTEELEKAYQQAVRRAEYVEAVTGATHKLIAFGK